MTLRTRFPLGGLAAALVAAALAACGSTSLKSSVGFSRPTAVAVFFGVAILTVAVTGITR